MTLINKRVLFAAFILLGFSFQVFSEQQETPKTLEPWKSWVLVDDKILSCPFINHSPYSKKSNHICAWPSELTINATATSSTFSQKWNVLIDSNVILPGDTEHWPSKVTVNGKAWPVLVNKNKPVLRLPKGEHRIKGHFNWSKIPEILTLAPSTHIVKLTVNDKPISFPKNTQNQLWFDQQAQALTEQDSEIIDVVRKVSDGDFIQLETHVHLSISGMAREINLGKVLPEGFNLAGIKSELNSYIDANGNLHSKVKSGDWTINIISFAQATQLSWRRPASSAIWPTQEIWVFNADEKLRMGKLNGASMTDNSQADIPYSWEKYPSYLMTEQSELVYSIQHRGQPSHIENQLKLKRSLWLSFDKKELSFNDKISGKMHDDWRLNMASPYQLVSAKNKDGSLLITQLDDKSTGVENRYPSVDISAQGIFPHQVKIPVTGWEENFEHVDITLNLPPASLLLAVFGADSSTGSWLGQWSIWICFLVLICTTMAWKILDKRSAVVTFIFLTLTFHNPNAPIFTIINFLIATAIYRYQPFESLKTIIRTYWIFSTAAVFLALLFFSVVQLRTTIYPQLADTGISNVHRAEVAQHKIKAVLQKPAMQSITPLQDASDGEAVERIEVTGSRIKRVDLLEGYQADVKFQAGEGIPNWRWQQHRISWQSSVAKNQTFDLFILTGWSYVLVKLLGIVMAFCWIAVVLRKELQRALVQLKNHTPKIVPETKVLCLILMTSGLLPFISTQAVAVEFPEKWMLDELHSRLVTPPDCAPACASINTMRIATDEQHLSLAFDVHAENQTAIAIPTSPFWFMQQISINGSTSKSLFKRNGKTYLPIVPGITKVNIQGRIAQVEHFQLRFFDKPKNVFIKDNTHWQVLGLQQHTLAGNTLEFAATSSQKNDSQMSRYVMKPQVKVHRQLMIDQTWHVTTQIHRVAPLTGAINVSVPLLKNERITSANVTVENGQALIHIAAGQQQVRWDSIIAKESTLNLKAESSDKLAEHWSFIVIPTYHTVFSGLPSIIEQQDDEDYYQYHFYPQQNEVLSVNIDRPKAVSGNTLAIDEVKQTLNQGLRTSTLELEFLYRSTQGGEHTINLPTDFELKKIEHDGSIINVQLERDKLVLPVYPGDHRYRINMRSNSPIVSRLSAPTVNLNAPMSNIETRINLGSNRWLLWVDGPTLGPAVLYWGELLAFIIIAVIVTRIPFSPLSPLAWLLLGLGLSLNNWSMLVLLFIWFTAITASKYRPDTLSRSWFNVSQLLLFGLTIIVIISLLTIIPVSLLGSGSPNMGIESYTGSSRPLTWFLDRSSGLLPSVQVISISTLWYKLIMLLWVLWLCFSCLNWLKWAWKILGAQGYWKSIQSKKITQSNP